MNKFKCILVLVLFCLVIPKVDALSYDLKTKLEKDGGSNLYKITVSLDDISGTDYGIGACSLELDYSDDVSLAGDIITSNNWNMTEGKIYLFDTGTPVKKSGDFLIIPVKASDDGYVELKNIKCSDDEKEVKISNKKINIEYNSNSSNNGSVNNNPNTGIYISTTVIIIIMIGCIIYFVYYNRHRDK